MGKGRSERFPELLGLKTDAILVLTDADISMARYTIKSLLSIPNITPPQLLPTYSY